MSVKGLSGHQLREMLNATPSLEPEIRGSRTQEGKGDSFVPATGNCPGKIDLPIMHTEPIGALC